MTSLTHFIIRALQKIRLGAPGEEAAHLALGRRGESEAYFYLKRQGYRMVSNNFRVPHDRGEIDLIGWDGKVLCFVEVKTRSDDSFAPPSTAVTRQKQNRIRSVAKRYVRGLSARPSCRFDVLSVVPSAEDGSCEFTLRKGAFSWDGDTQRSHRWPH